MFGPVTKIMFGIFPPISQLLGTNVVFFFSSSFFFLPISCIFIYSWTQGCLICSIWMKGFSDVTIFGRTIGPNSEGLLTIATAQRQSNSAKHWIALLKMSLCSKNLVNIVLRKGTKASLNCISAASSSEMSSLSFSV